MEFHGVTFWLAATFGAALLYDVRASAQIESLIKTKLGWAMALVCGLSVMVISLSFYRLDLGSMEGFKRDAILAVLGAFICYRISHLGLRFWFTQDWWVRPAHLAAALLTLCFVARPATIPPDALNNLLLLTGAVGLGCYMGRWATKGFAYVLFLMLMVFDVYAVWFSDIMETIIEKVPEAVPAGFVIMTAWKEFLGAGDVIFSTMGMMIVCYYCGRRWAVIAALGHLLCVEGFFTSTGQWFIGWLDLKEGFFPLMLTIGPVTLVCLYFGDSDRRRIADQR